MKHVIFLAVMLLVALTSYVALGFIAASPSLFSGQVAAPTRVMDIVLKPHFLDAESLLDIPPCNCASPWLPVAVVGVGIGFEIWWFARERKPRRDP